MVKLALFVRLEAKPGREAELESFLKSGLPIVQQEPGTTAWFGVRLGASTFGIFDVFRDEHGRQAHLSGRVAASLMAKAPELLAEPPIIQKFDVLGAKLPGGLWSAKKMRTALGLAGVIAAGWFAARRLWSAPGTSFEKLAHEPVSTPL